MFGRGRREAERSRGLRWFAGGAALVVASGAVALAMQPAHAAPAAPIDATFGLTGVTTSNCSVATGGQNIYVTPGGELDFQSSVATLKLLSLPVSTKNIAGLDGNLVIDPTATSPTKIKVTTSKAQKLSSLSAGDHAYTFSVTGIDVAGLVLPITLSSANTKAGLSLTWRGTIHVTDDAANCGISLSLPEVGGTVQLPGLPAVTATILPQINVPTIAVPTLPAVPGLGGHKTTTPPASGTKTGTGTKTSTGFNPGGLTIPEQVVPKGDGDGPGTVDLSGFGDALPNLGSGGGAGFVAPNLAGGTLPATAPNATSTPVAQLKQDTVELASSPSPSAQMPVLLAIIAIIALSLVTATYARLYLLRKV